MARSAVGVNESVSAAELFPGVGSVVPLGAATVAVFVSVPVAVAEIVPDTVYVAVAPTGSVTVSLMEPVPEFPHDAPELAAHVQATPVSAAGTESVTVAPTANDGPRFVTTIVYESDVPGTAFAFESVFVIARSAVRTTTSVSVAELFADVGSVDPAGTAMVAVLVTEPVADGESVAVTRNVTDVPDGRTTSWSMSPEPLDVHVAPPVPVQLHTEPVSADGSVSTTCAPGAVDGPALATTIEYVSEVPAVALSVPSVLVIERSEIGVKVSVSVPELLPRVGSVVSDGGAIDAVLESEPVATWETVAVIVYVAVPPTSNDALSLIDPLPDAAQLEPEVAEHVHVAPVSDDDKRSDVTAPTTLDGPALVATIVYVTVWPGTAVGEPSVFVTERSATRASVSVSVAVLLAGVGSVTPVGAVTLAVLESVPLAVEASSAVSVYVAVAPLGRFTVSVIEPVPLAVHVAPLDAEHVHVAALRADGSESVTVAPVTADGPTLVATIV